MLLSVEMGICALLCMGWYLQPFPRGEGVQHWDLGVVFGRVSALLERSLCLSAVWWLWGFLAGLSPLLRGSSGLSNSLCEQRECLSSPPAPLGVCFTTWSYHTFLWGTVRKAQPDESQGLCPSWDHPNTYTSKPAHGLLPKQPAV